jgi:hypothetical protein
MASAMEAAREAELVAREYEKMRKREEVDARA